jgi:hypothetical protein
MAVTDSDGNNDEDDDYYGCDSDSEESCSNVTHILFDKGHFL